MIIPSIWDNKIHGNQTTNQFQVIQLVARSLFVSPPESPGADAALRHVRGDGDGREAGRDLGQLHRHLGVGVDSVVSVVDFGGVMICK